MIVHGELILHPEKKKKPLPLMTCIHFTRCVVALRTGIENIYHLASEAEGLGFDIWIGLIRHRIINACSYAVAV